MKNRNMTAEEVLKKHCPLNEDGQPLQYENDLVLVNKAVKAMEEYAGYFRLPLPISEVKKMADEKFEGCDGCTEFEEKMWKDGFVSGYFNRLENTDNKQNNK